MGLFGDLLSIPTHVASVVADSVGEISGLKRVTNLATKPLEGLTKALEQIDE